MDKSKVSGAECRREQNFEHAAEKRGHPLPGAIHTKVKKSNRALCRRPPQRKTLPHFTAGRAAKGGDFDCRRRNCTTHPGQWDHASLPRSW